MNPTTPFALVIACLRMVADFLEQLQQLKLVQMVEQPSTVTPAPEQPPATTPAPTTSPSA